MIRKYKFISLIVLCPLSVIVTPLAITSCSNNNPAELKLDKYFISLHNTSDWQPIHYTIKKDTSLWSIKSNDVSIYVVQLSGIEYLNFTPFKIGNSNTTYEYYVGGYSPEKLKTGNFSFKIIY
ncbi:MAG: hypothetical protein LBT77_02000 [Mycoplasmataceae bacterium]|jgi:hypothetical protein|nr:hypothetical protein [Mycoplasmataceae bacterium]